MLSGRADCIANVDLGVEFLAPLLVGQSVLSERAQGLLLFMRGREWTLVHSLRQHRLFCEQD